MEKARRELTALTPDNVAARVTLKDDALESDALFTTEPIYQERGGLLRVMQHDSFLRAFVDKHTGEVSWQAYVLTTYGGSWRFYEQVNFQTTEGVQTLPLTVIDRQVNDCSGASIGIGCDFTEQVGFTLPEVLVRGLARLYDPQGQLTIWSFRLKSRAGLDYTDGFAVAEIAGLVKAVDDYRAVHKLDGPMTPMSPVPGGAVSTTPLTGPALLGVQLVATPFGAVIGTVAPGGRAAIAGITPGTVVTAVDGKSIVGLAVDDMRKALAQPGRHILAVMGKPDIVVH